MDAVVIAPQLIHQRQIGEFTAWILRSSAISFVAGCRTLVKDGPQFGNLVRVLVQEGINVFGLIYRVEVRHDPVARQLVLTGNLEPDQHPNHRLAG